MITNICRSLALIAAVAFGSCVEANAAVIAGPVLNIGSSNWQYTGVAFQANQNSTLTGFTYQNQGLADTVVLTDLAGNILQSVAIPSGSPSHVAVVSWGLTAGDDYRLLTTTNSNPNYANYGAALPGNADISITKSGFFSNIIGLDTNFAPNQYWAAFNDITTDGVAAVPEPASFVLFSGLSLAGCMFMRRKKAENA